MQSSGHPVVIARTQPEDAEVICEIRDRAWLLAYPNVRLGITLDDIRLNAQGPRGEFVPRRIAYLKDQLANNEQSKLTMYSAKIDNKVVGYVQPEVDQSGRRRISAIYVAPEVQGSGVGGKLLGKALEVLGRDYDIYLEVVSYNQQAIGFYEHFGLEKTDAVVPEEQDRPSYLKSLPQIEMVLRAKKW